MILPFNQVKKGKKWAPSGEGAYFLSVDRGVYLRKRSGRAKSLVSYGASSSLRKGMGSGTASGLGVVCVSPDPPSPSGSWVVVVVVVVVVTVAVFVQAGSVVTSTPQGCSVVSHGRNVLGGVVVEGCGG